MSRQVQVGILWIFFLINTKMKAIPIITWSTVLLGF